MYLSNILSFDVNFTSFPFLSVYPSLYTNFERDSVNGEEAPSIASPITLITDDVTGLSATLAGNPILVAILFATPVSFSFPPRYHDTPLNIPLISPDNCAFSEDAPSNIASAYPSPDPVAKPVTPIAADPPPVAIATPIVGKASPIPSPIPATNESFFTNDLSSIAFPSLVSSP